MLFQSDESRYNQWVREHYRFLLRSAWALTGSRAMAEDVVQDCFANAWKHREQLRDATLARAWLFQIMRRAAFRQATPGMQSLDDEEQPEQAAPDAGLDDMPTAQMAEALEIAPGTVLSRLARARDALKCAMGVPVQAPSGARVTALRKTST